MTLSWTHPWALALLALIPLYLLAMTRGPQGLPFPRAASFGGSGRSAVLLGWLPHALRSLVLALLVVAIAGPRTAGAVIEERRPGVPMVLAIDISSSMLAQDFAPLDRLEMAKATIARFIAARPDDPMALVAFAGEALTLVPLTQHRGVLVNAVESLRIGLLEDGTAIGDGLATALNRLRAIEAEERVVVLLSDGENNRGEVDPLEAAHAAAALGIQVFTVGVGSDGVAPFPVSRLPEGFRYAELSVGLDEALLREIAEATGGRYFRAADPDALEEIYAEIDRLVPAIVEVDRFVEARPWSLAFLLVAGLALLGEWSVRASRWGALP